MSNLRKYFIRVPKREKLEPFQVRYAVKIDEHEPIDFPTKLEMYDYISQYRHEFNQINSISMYKIQVFSLIDKNI